MQFTDRMTTSGTLRKTDDGHVVQARVARGGNVQDYLGSELGSDKAIVRVYRPADAVFAREAIATYARKPITIGHPAGGVTDETWKDLAVGEIDRDVMRDGEFVSVPLLFRDAAAVALMQDASGPRELSMGYEAGIDFADGVTPDGQPYDAIMSGFKMNHVAVVPKARGGADLRIGDSAATWGLSPITVADKKEDIMSDTLQTVVLGDQAAQVALADAPKVEAFKADMAKKLTDAQTAHATAIAAKDAEIAKADAARDAAEAKVLSDADLDKRVADRADLIAVAKTIDADVATAGLSDAAIRKAVVVAKLGDAMADKPDAYIVARFDALADAVEGTDAIADAIVTSKAAPKVVTLDAAYDARDADLSNAWMSKPAKEA